MRGISCLFVLATLLVITAALPQSSSGSRPNAGRRNWWGLRRTRWPDVPDRAFMPVTDTNPAFAAAAIQARTPALPVPAPARQTAQEISMRSQAGTSRMGGPGSAFRPVTRRPDEAGPSRPVFPAAAPASGAGSSQEAGRSRAPAEAQLQGTAQDPIYGLGHSKFVARAYQIDTPTLRHLYSQNDAVPANFEDFVRGSRFASLGTVYQPDPALLHSIQSTIWSRLGNFGYNPNRVAGTPDLMEGQFLSPPLNRDFNGRLFMPTDVLRRLRGTLTDRLRRFDPASPDLFHLNVEGRHILAFTTRPVFQANVPFAPSMSDLWMFFEMMTVKGVKTTIPHMTLLGSTFLPKGFGSVGALSDVMRPAIV